MNDKIKSSTITCKIDTELKNNVENILNRLGLNHSVAINLLYNQIELTNSLPFPLTVPTSKKKKGSK